MRKRFPLPKPSSQFGRLSTYIVLFGLLVCLQSGCQLTREQTLRRFARIANWNNDNTVTVVPKRDDSTRNAFRQYFAQKPLPSPRTEIQLRKYSLLQRYEENPQQVIEWFQELTKGTPSMAEVHALAEIAIIEADWLDQRGKTEEATNLYAVAVIHAYQFLFDQKLDISRNAYDPQFRSICDIYNRSLEGMLRKVCGNGQFVPGQSVDIGSGLEKFEFEIKIDGRWSDQEFERFELVNDYQTEGIENQFHTYGLGVPLLAIRKKQAINTPMEKFYPPELTLPMTAFCHFHADHDSDQVDDQDNRRHAVLTLYDPLERTTIETDSQTVPLESDITTPLAYNLRDPLLNSGILATASLLDAEYNPEIYGMYMLEPYDPNKIPVVMVHGFWSSPTTWVRMFNDLRANSEIHDNYQFWFYSYPSGQPFWLSARQMRWDLAMVRRELDPQDDSPSLDQMILVGHSMGGLISTLQATESGDQFWEMVSDETIDNFEGDPAAIELLKETFFFAPNDSISRVISIATPFQGSTFANSATRWIGKKLFTLPKDEARVLKDIAAGNGPKIKDNFFLTTVTSLDSLAPNSTVFDIISNANVSQKTTFHNVVGQVPKKTWFASSKEAEPQGDGVVSAESAKNGRAISEIVVPAEHSLVHQHPACIYEVRRILLENLVAQNRIRRREIPQLPVDEVAQPVDQQSETKIRPVSGLRSMIRGAQELAADQEESTDLDLLDPYFSGRQ